MIAVLDIETTGLDPGKDRVIEIGAVQVIEDGRGGWAVGDGYSGFVASDIPIPPEASAIHHIVAADLEGAPKLESALLEVLDEDWRSSGGTAAGHNCRFERAFLPSLCDRPWIDTYRCALHVWPDAPNFKNQTLRYWLGLNVPKGPPHRALGDATVTAHILVRLLAERGEDELRRLSTKAAALKRVGFGKHFGGLWTEVPTDYLDWAAKQDFDPDVMFTVRSELTRRRS